MTRSDSDDEGVPSARRPRIEEERSSPTLGGRVNDLVVCYYCLFAPCVVSEDFFPEFVRGFCGVSSSRVLPSSYGFTL